MRSRPGSAASSSRQPPWLLLVYQLPSRPSNARVKTWRRLQSLGALGLKNSAYLLPNSPQAREDFEWIKTEIVAMKGEARVFAAESVDALSGDQIVAAFRRARQQDFESLRRDAEKLLAADRSGRARREPQRRHLERAARLLRQHWNAIAAMDFFGAPGRDEAAATLDHLEQLPGGGRRQALVHNEGDVLMPEKFRDRVWVTRPRPGIDRMGTAWLIRRFVDPRARFHFAEKAEKNSTAVPFDMFGVEFSHQGNACTFETFARRFGIANPAVEWLGRIVHDLDLKEERYGVPEGIAIGRLVDGLRQMYSDDQELLERGIAMFEALYRSFTGKPAGGKTSTKSRVRSKRACERKVR